MAGAEHFRTTVETGLEIIKGLRGWTSGLAVPHFVIDAPGGGGKIPLLPEYVERITDDEVVLRNFRGKRYVWKQPREEESLVGAGIHEPEYGFMAEFEIGKPRNANGKKTTKRKR